MDHDLTRAAQARRRQRVVMNSTTGNHNNNNNNNSNLQPPPSAVDNITTSSNDDTTNTITTNHHNTTNNHNTNWMDQSMEAGNDAASLLASIRKEKQKLLLVPLVPVVPHSHSQSQSYSNATTTHQQQQQQPQSTVTVTAPTNDNTHRVQFKIDSLPNQQQRQRQQPSSVTNITESSLLRGSTTTGNRMANIPVVAPLSISIQSLRNELSSSSSSLLLLLLPITSKDDTTEFERTLLDDDDDEGRDTSSVLNITNGSCIRIQSNAHPTQTISAAITSDTTTNNNNNNNNNNIDDDDNNNDDGSPTTTTILPATLNGNFLQDSMEILQIVRTTLESTKNDNSNNHNNNHHHHHHHTSDVIYFGDTVSFYLWGSTKNDMTTAAAAAMVEPTNTNITLQQQQQRLYVLTCIKNISSTKGNNINNNSLPPIYDMQFVPLSRRPANNAPPYPTPTKAQQWMILSPSLCGAISIGQTALEEEAIRRLSNHHHHHRHPSTTTTTAATTNSNSSQQHAQLHNKIPIRMGDEIILRNCATGGIVTSSLYHSSTEIGNNRSNLHILTDATFQPLIDMTEDDDHPNQHRRVTTMSTQRRDETSLMSQLEQSGKLIPSSHEIFSLVNQSLPMVPLWMYNNHHPSSNIVQREIRQRSPNSTTACYMDMSYLLYPERHETMSDIATTSFMLDVMTIGDTAIDDDRKGQTTGTDNINERSNSIQGQEQLLLHELINACMGLEGQYIRAVSNQNKNIIATFHPSTIRHDMDQIQFHLFDDVQCRWDVIVRRLIEDMLLLPTLFVRLQYFLYDHTPGYEYGHVMQAFCARLGQLIHEYIGIVVSWYRQYSDRLLTLTKFQTQLHTSMHTLSILYQICQVVQSQKGGSLINAIRQWQRLSSDGDTESETIVKVLLDAATVPFMKRLSEWLEMGILTDDPHNEFMIESNIDRNTSWENRYSISQSNVIEGFFATEQLVEQALATGRYWNAVRSCRHSLHPTNEISTSMAIQYSSSVSSISAFIQTRYRDASRSLLRLLMVEYDLINVLRTMRQYFLLEHGDFFVDFLDCAEEELLKDVTQLSRTRIQHWINNCRQTMDQNDDVRDVDSKDTIVVDGLRCRISTDGLAEYLDQLHAASGGIDTKDAWTPMRHTYGGTLTSTKSELTGLDTFYLDLVSVPFPISTVLSPSAMGCYHLLFRHLFFAKYVERRMVSIWKDHQMMKELKLLRGPMGTTFLLRQRMLHLLQNLIYYMMFEVIEPNWLNMEKSMNTPTSTNEQTVDDILHHHSHFLQRTLEACLLTNRDVVRALTKLLKTCLLFSEQMKRFMNATKLEEERTTVAIEKQKAVQHDFYSRFTKRTSTKSSTKHLQENFRRNRSERLDRIQVQSARIEREVSGEPYRRMITRFEEVFTKNLRDFMIQINNSDDIFHTHKVNLCIRLDYNGYITKSLGLVKNN